MPREAPTPKEAKPAAAGTTAAGQERLSFEAGLQQLETIVKEMETGELPLERALGLFERGMTLSETCRKQLVEAETRVEILMKRAGTGDAQEREPQPFRPEQ